MFALATLEKYLPKRLMSIYKFCYAQNAIAKSINAAMICNLTKHTSHKN